MLELPLKRCVQDVAMTQSDSATSAEPRELVRLSTDALREFRDRERARYEAIKARATPFNLARGKPATEQVALANQLLTAVATPEQCWTEDGNDCWNYYGSPQGLIEVRRLFAPMLGAPPEQVLVANNSSLALMHDAVVYALLTGARDGAAPWRDQHRPIRFLCPSPGYDRHFQICEQYGIEMIAVPLTGAGPDMAEVERLAADPAVKGMWCVPKYSHPTGSTMCLTLAPPPATRIGRWCSARPRRSRSRRLASACSRPRPPICAGSSRASRPVPSGQTSSTSCGMSWFCVTMPGSPRTCSSSAVCSNRNSQPCRTYSRPGSAAPGSRPGLTRAAVIS